MVGDMTEATQSLCKSIEKQSNGDEKIESNNKKYIKSCYADSVEMSTLNESIQFCAQSNQHEKEESSNKSAEEIESECVQAHAHASVSGIRQMRDCADDSQLSASG